MTRPYGSRQLERPYVPYYGESTDLDPGQSKVLLKPAGAQNDVELVTLHLSATIAGVDVLPAAISTRVFASLQWGGGATVHQAFCDVGRGMSLTLAASALDVGVFYTAGDGPRLTIHGTLAYGSRTSPTLSPGCTFTDGPFTFTELLPIVSRVPPFARSATLLIDRASAVVVAQRFTSDLAGTLVTFKNLDLASASYPSQFPVPPFAQFFRVSSAAPITVVAWVLYELSL